MAAALVVIVLAGCGGKNARPRVTLLLDFTPNAVHTGIYSAVAHHFDRSAGVRLTVRVPSASPDAVKLLAAGKTDLAILDIHDLGLAREHGQDIVGVMALVQRPLAAVIVRPGVATPRQLAGRTVGVTGVPSDDAVLRSIVSGAGGDPARVRPVTIGFNAVPNLLSGRIAGATAFWNAEGVALSQKRPGFHSFRVDDYGAPAYPELVVCTTRRTLRTRRAALRDALRAIARGYRFTNREPRSGARDLLRAQPGLDRRLTLAQLEAVRPAFFPPDGRYGELDETHLRAWAAWDQRFGILSRAPDVSRTFERVL